MAVVAIVVAAICTFARATSFDFIALDDATHVTSNPIVLNAGWHSLAQIWTQPYFGMYIPVVYSTWMATAAATYAFGLSDATGAVDATLFHTLNVSLHLLNGLMILGALTFILNRVNPESPRPLVLTAALTAALFFTAHPVQVEPVAWVSGLKDVLSTFFCLGSLLLYLHHQDRPPSNLSLSMLGTSVALFVLALMCKPNIIVFPAVLLVVGWLLPTRRSLMSVAPYFLVALPFALLTVSLQPDSRLDFDYALWERPVIALYSTGFYLGKLLWPVGLVPDYGLTPPAVFKSMTLWPYLVTGLVAFGGTAFALIRAPRWAAGPVIFIVGLLPIMGLVAFEFQNISTVADRYLYFLPMFGIGLLIAQVVIKLGQHLAALIASLTFVGLIALGFLQVSIWEDDGSLFSRVLAVNPRSSIANTNVGLSMLEGGDLEQAKTRFQTALAAKPGYLPAQVNLGAVYARQQQYEKVIAYFEEVLADQPEPGPGSSLKYADLYYNLAAAYVNTRRVRESIEYFNKAVAIHPGHFPAQHQLGRVHLFLDEFDAARAALKRAESLNPRNADVQRDLQVLAAKTGEGG